MQVTGIDSYFLHKSLFTILITLAQHLCSDFLLVYKNASYSQTRLCPHQMLPVRFFWTFIQIAPSFLLWPEAPTPHWCTGSEHQSTDCPYCSAPTFGFVLGYPVSPWYRYPTSLSILTSPEWKCQCSSLLALDIPFCISGPAEMNGHIDLPATSLQMAQEAHHCCVKGKC